MPAPTDKADTTNTAVRIIWFITGVVLTLLAFRFVLILLGANQANGFVNFIYSLSHPFAAPFFGIFSYDQTLGVAKFELSTLVAMLVYSLVAFGIVRLLTIRRPRAV
ncbi:YggT family protein [Aeromicrobium sp.]|nr:YggT family protein [Candidatus Saccharibacteria bacterium]